MPALPCRGHVIGNHPDPNTVIDALVAGGIQVTQLAMGLEFWRLTHVRLYIGRLSEHRLEAELTAGRLDQAEAARLHRGRHWAFSMTMPRGRWDDWREIADTERWLLAAPLFCGFLDTWAAVALESAAWWWYGRPYDWRQLFGFLEAELGEQDPHVYRSRLDRGPGFTFCSGAVAACFEYARRFGLLQHFAGAEAPEFLAHATLGHPRPLPPQFPLTTLSPNDALWPWPRLHHGRHLERWTPAHLFARRHFRPYAAARAGDLTPKGGHR